VKVNKTYLKNIYLLRRFTRHFHVRPGNLTTFCSRLPKNSITLFLRLIVTCFTVRCLNFCFLQISFTLRYSSLILDLLFNLRFINVLSLPEKQQGFYPEHNHIVRISMHIKCDCGRFSLCVRLCSYASIGD